MEFAVNKGIVGQLSVNAGAICLPKTQCAQQNKPQGLSQTSTAILCLLLCLTLSVHLDQAMAVDDVSHNTVHGHNGDPPTALTLGIFPRRMAINNAVLFTPLAKYLSQKLKRPVNVVSSPDFEQFWQGVESLRFDIVHYNQYHYVKSHKLHGYKVIVKNEEFGKSTIAGALVVRKDSGIRKITDLRGKKIVFGGGRSAMQSYIVATYLLRKAGLMQGDYKEFFTNTPPNAILAPFFGETDAGGVGNLVMQLPVISKKIDTSKLMFLAMSNQLPHLPWAISPNVSVSLAKHIRQSLLSLSETEGGRNVLQKAELTGLISVKDSEYDEHRRIILDVLGEEY